MRTVTVTVTATIDNVVAQAQIIIAPSALRITPSAATMLVGDSRAFTVVDEFGRPFANATWTVSDPTLATITEEGSPAFTAVAAGSLLLTASIGGVTAETPVTIVAGSALAAGTPRWSAPTVQGLSATQMVQARPVDGGPDFYAISGSATESLIQALTVDGRQLWQNWLPALNTNSVPDASGGLIVTMDNTCESNYPMRLVKLDARTGQPQWEFVGQLACPSDAPQIAVRPDNVLIVTTAGNFSGFPELLMIDSDAGQVIGAPAIPQSSFKDITGTVFWGYSRIGPPMVDSDGIVHLTYEVRHVDYPPRVISTELWLMNITKDGTSTTTLVTSTAEDVNLFPGRIIPDGRGGLVATWTVSPSQPPALEYPFRAAHVTTAGVAVYTLPIVAAELLRAPSGVPINPLLVLGETDVAFASYDSTLVSFNYSSGAVNWSTTASQKMTIIASTDSNGVVVRSGDGTGAETVQRFDAGGNVTTDVWTGSGIEYVAGDLWIDLASGQFLARSAGLVALSTTGWSSPTQKGQSKAIDNIYVPQPLQTDPNQAMIGNMLVGVKAALLADPPGTSEKPSCAEWLATGALSGQAMIDLILPDSFGHGIISSVQTSVVPTLATNRISAFKYGTNPDKTKPVGVPTSFSVTVNDNGAFFNRYDPLDNRYEFKEGKYYGGTTKAQARILIHELAHLVFVPGFLPDFGDPKAAKNNDDLIQRHCSALVERIQ